MNDTLHRPEPCTRVWSERAHDVFCGSGLTLHQVGIRMGFPDSVARLAVWHFLFRTPDPNLSEVRKFADAVEVPLAALFD